MPLGVFDPTAVPEGWFDETAQPAGWFDSDLLDQDNSTPRPDIGPFSRLGLAGVSQRLYGSFAGKTGDAFPVTATDTLSVAVTESVQPINSQLAVTDTLSVAVTDAVTLLEKRIAVTDTLSVGLTDTSSLLQSENKTVSDTLTVALADAATVVDVTPTETEPEVSGGFYYELLHRERLRRLRKKREEEEAEAEREIADETSREIARLMHEQTEREAQAAELEALRRIAQRYSDEIESNARLERALAQALAKQTEGAWLALQREAERAEEEELLAALTLLLDD